MNVTTPIEKVRHVRVIPPGLHPVSPRRDKTRSPLPLVVKILLGVLAIPALVLVSLYIALLIQPIPLPFVRDQARSAVLDSLPPGSNLQLGDMALALEGHIRPVIQFSPVVYTDSRTGARIGMKALEVGFSPFRALIGQPGATITMVAPHIQIAQDLLGPRLSSFKIVDSPTGGQPTVQVLQGKQTFPRIVISGKGVDVVGGAADGERAALQSDNAWLIDNLEAFEQSLQDIARQADAGRFSRLVIRDGVLDVDDTVYGLLRQFTDISLNIAPRPLSRNTVADFSASLAGRVLRGSATRSVGRDGAIKLDVAVSNIDFASILPFLDDPDAMMAVRGGGALSMHVGYDKAGKVQGGDFQVDMTGTDLRVHDDFFPVVSSIADISWNPKTGQFDLAPTQLRVGHSSASLSGVFRLGLDPTYGPTVGLSLKANQVSLAPNDMPAPTEPFEEIDFSGWSAPLYGTLGIDQLTASKADGTRINANGRLDMLRDGVGFDLKVGGAGATADDLKRLWPYFISPEARDWFVDNVSSGKVLSATMAFHYPVGTLPKPGEDKPVPKGGITIDMVGTGVTVRAVESMAPVTITGNTQLKVRDSQLTVTGDGATVTTNAGKIDLAHAAVVMQSGAAKGRIIELSGDVGSDIPALVALARQQQPKLVSKDNLPLDPDALGGKVSLRLVATIGLDDKGNLNRMDYALNGNVADFSSSSRIADHKITNGQLAFTASQAGYHISGKAEVDGMPADFVADSDSSFQPKVLLTSTIDVKDLKSMGFDASPFLTGKVRFVARPMADGTLQMAVDIKDAGLTIKDLGISKPVGVPGSIEAAVQQDGSVTKLSQIKLKFGTVDLEGDLAYDDKAGLQSADFSKFALSTGDDARLSLSPIPQGYDVTIRGNQLDLKPMLQRFFGLGEGSVGAVASTQFDQTLALDIKLKRALGFYKTAAFNFDLDMAVRGSDLQKVNLQAQLGNDKTVSVTTNPSPNGRSITAAFNDFGSVLRLIGVYPRLEGGDGSLVLNTNTSSNVSTGEFQLHDFALIDEDKVSQILGNDHASGIARENKLAFKSGTLDFVRTADRIQVTNGVLAGDTVGGTVHGYIYTQRRQYDLVGTYVPLYGINNVFQKLPLFGPILGGKKGEGLIGVTFAVRGPLDHPDFQINPASLLMPGAFRGLFEYHAQDLPPESKGK